MQNSNTRLNTRNIKYLGYFSGAGGSGGFNPAYLTLPNTIRNGKYINFAIVSFNSESQFSNKILFSKNITA